MDNVIVYRNSDLRRCVLWPDGSHLMSLDLSRTDPSKTIYSCACGAEIMEFEDCGTGA